MRTSPARQFPIRGSSRTFSLVTLPGGGCDVVIDGAVVGRVERGRVGWVGLVPGAVPRGHDSRAGAAELVARSVVGCC